VWKSNCDLSGLTTCVEELDASSLLAPRSCCAHVPEELLDRKQFFFLYILTIVYLHRSPTRHRYLPLKKMFVYAPV
jgi:hypothetical protein